MDLLDSQTHPDIWKPFRPVDLLLEERQRIGPDVACVMVPSPVDFASLQDQTVLIERNSAFRVRSMACLHDARPVVVRLALGRGRCCGCRVWRAVQSGRQDGRHGIYGDEYDRAAPWFTGAAKSGLRKEFGAGCAPYGQLKWTEKE